MSSNYALNMQTHSTVTLQCQVMIIDVGISSFCDKVSFYIENNYFKNLR